MTSKPEVPMTEEEQINEEVSVTETESPKVVEETKTPIKKKVQKSTIFISTAVVALGALSGVALGLYIRSQGLSARRDFDEEQYRDDFTEIEARYQEARANKCDDYTTVLSPVEMIQIAFDHLVDTPYLSESVGVSANNYSGDQLVTSIKGRVDDVFYFETISFGSAVQLGRRYYQEEAQINYHQYDKIIEDQEKDIVTATYKADVHTMTADEYKGIYGSFMDDPTDYLFTSKTVMPETTPTMKKVGDTYEIEVSFSEDATETYKTRIIAMDSKVTNVPKFYYVNFKCTLDQDLRFISSDIDEKYDTLALGWITAKCEGTLATQYYYQEDGLTSEWLPSGSEAYVFQEEKQ